MSPRCYESDGGDSFLFTMIVLAIDPGPLLSGYVVVEDNKVISFGKINLKQIKALPYKFDTILIEVTDWPIQNAGESFRDTCIVAGRLIEYFSKTCVTLQLGRQHVRNTFNLKNDSEVVKYLKTKGLKLVKDSWQAYLLYHFYSTKT